MNEPTRAAAAPISVLQAEQRAWWERGETPRAEAYLERHPELQSDPDGFLDLIYNEVLLREERGEAPTLNEYLGRFPQFAEQLRAQFEVHSAFRPAPAPTVVDGA